MFKALAQGARVSWRPAANNDNGSLGVSSRVQQSFEMRCFSFPAEYRIEIHISFLPVDKPGGHHDTVLSAIVVR
jgi:hypothetical protein